MNLSISNIAWEKENDDVVYKAIKKNGFTGLEIAPTRIFSEQPYNKLKDAVKWAENLKKSMGISVSSMQSIWYGRNEKIFGSQDEKEILLDYTKKAIDFAEAIGCKNLVFGCPKNRLKPDDYDDEIAICFFKELGEYAVQHGTVIGIEANPVIYGTNFINDTKSALQLIKDVSSEGFRLNLDLGTMIENGEDIQELEGNEKFINHVHISEPWLKPLQNRNLHIEIAELLKKSRYENFVSIEMGRQEDINTVFDVMDYVKGVFYDI